MSKATKSSKPARKSSKPQFAIVERTTAAYTTKLGTTDAVRHQAKFGFSSGRTISASAAMRWLGFTFGASTEQAENWLRYVGITGVTKQCAGHQSGSGRRSGRKKNKDGTPKGKGLHGFVPVLPKEDAAELQASYLAANPDVLAANPEAK